MRFGYRGYVLSILTLIYCVSYMDRQIIAVLSPQIKGDLGLSDTQLGLLKGTAFALFYSTMAIPLAILGDRTNRTKLVAASLALWSATTALCGLATGFIQLFALRMAVGIGEAGSTPSSHSLLADYFERAKRSTALAIYSLGVPLGTLVGLMFGGWLADRFGWRTTLVVLGAPGVLLAVVTMLTVDDRPRGAAETGSAPLAPRGSIRSAARLLFSIPAYRTIVISGAFTAFAGYAISMWMVDFYVTTRHVPIASVSFWLALAFGVGGGIGTLGGGLAADRFGRKDASHYLVIPGIALVAAAPLILLCVSAPTMAVSIASLFVVNGLMYASFGPLYGLIQTLTPIGNRSLAVSLHLLFQSVVGAGLGPLAIGVASDLLSLSMPRGAALTAALGALAVPLLVSGAVLLAGRRRLVGDTVAPR